MSWFWLALLSAFCLASADALTKKFLANLSAWQMGAIRIGYGALFLFPLLFFIPWPPLKSPFWLTLGLLYPLELLALVLYMKALKESPLSLCLPLLSFTPVFLIFTGWFILNEKPNLWGIIGIILVVLGTYLLYLPSRWFQFRSFLNEFWRQRGSFLMLMVAFIYAITSALGKRAILYSNPIFFGCFYYLGLALFFIPSYIKHPVLYSKKNFFIGVIVGGLTALMIIFHVLAITKTKAVYMISVKRLSPLLGVIYGGLIFKEERFCLRFFAATCMCLGAIIIYFWGMK